ncbi:hypothetical protein [Agrobacterium sp. B1(2019)]|uniref:hypothetical protein n=1 Tax=Agrobacterium sp. B1(2019) TaxID=2607032 RepID=UPI0011EFCE53|nr:hypothetical protein [Agrobacterium sp. B1(2019)]TZG36635.1 hypothetical protein AGR1_03815 [Agrobacterium sp. B1(2019)]
MKEVTTEDIRKIEGAELRWLTRYEHLISWGKSGTLRKAAQAFYNQIAAAEQAKAVAVFRIAQINVIEKAVARFDVKSIRNAQMAAVAAKHRANAAERQAIQAACDEIMALEEIVPADDIDDILSTVSAALGIELPGHDAKADICQRGAKSMDDLKRELGPSLWDRQMGSSFPFHDLACAEPIVRAPWNEGLSKIELWAISHFSSLTDDVFEWIARNKDNPEWADDALDDEVLVAACNVVSHPFDAGPI